MKENGFEYVDLGLPSGTMWATCNVGASKPEDEGLLFQFGRVDGYKYADTNNKFRTLDQNEQDTGDKDIPQTASNKVYNVKDILELEDDAAHVNMGGKCRMSSNDELKELYNNATYNVETINGTNGMMFTSKKNGKQIFIPFAGFWYNESFNGLGSSVNLWSSQVQSVRDNFAYNLCCNSGGDVYYNFRSNAFSVRGVFKK